MSQITHVDVVIASTSKFRQRPTSKRPSNLTWVKSQEPIHIRVVVGAAGAGLTPSGLPHLGACPVITASGLATNRGSSTNSVRHTTAAISRKSMTPEAKTSATRGSRSRNVIA
jgi:hypothetical protein